MFRDLELQQRSLPDLAGLLKFLPRVRRENLLRMMQSRTIVLLGQNLEQNGAVPPRLLS